jgi:hypothetical protein
MKEMLFACVSLVALTVVVGSTLPIYRRSRCRDRHPDRRRPRRFLRLRDVATARRAAVAVVARIADELIIDRHPRRSGQRIAVIGAARPPQIRLARRFCSLYVLCDESALRNEPVMADQIVITEKSSQAKDVPAAVGTRYGEILGAEGHLFDLLEPEDVVPAWKRWSPILLRPGRALRHSPGGGRQQSRQAQSHS